MKLISSSIWVRIFSIGSILLVLILLNLNVHNQSVARALESPPVSVWYLAEGYTGAGFGTYILIQNPNADAANVDVTYMLQDGGTLLRSLEMPGNSRYTIVTQDEAQVGLDQAFSTKLEADQPIIVERAMYWPNGEGTIGGHATLGIRQPETTWYLAEGYTGAGFGTYILIQNPNDDIAYVDVTYMLQGGGTVLRSVEVAVNSRYTIVAQDEAQVGAEQVFSTRLESNLPIVVERAMYFNNDGHAAGGVSTPRQTWYLAEGYTGADFGTYILIQNPNEDTANVDVTYMLQEGGTVERSVEVGANSRFTIVAQDEAQVGLDQAFSTKLASDVPIIVERAMYWPNGTGGVGGHDDVGNNQMETTWYLAEGYTGAGFGTYILIQNPNGDTAIVDVTYMLQGGGTVLRSLEVPGNSRYTIVTQDEAQVGLDQAFSTKLVSDVPIIVERAMYFSNGGHDATGMMLEITAEADLVLTKVLTDSSPYASGDTVTYTVTVTNNGPDTAVNLSVTDTDTNLTVTNVTSGTFTCVGNVFPCTLASLANGASAQITVTATIDANGAFDNEATVTSDTYDPYTSDNTDNDGDTTAIRIPSQSDWVDYGIILEAGAEGDWDYYLWGGFAFSVIKKDGIFYLYYQGASDYRIEYDETVLWRAIGLATSSDGIHFSKYFNNPVLTWFPNHYGEEGAVSSGVTLGDQGETILYYGANTQESSTTVNADVRVAFSSDGWSFIDQGIVLNRNDRSVWGSGDELFSVDAIYDSGQWIVYYIPNGTSESGMLGVAYGNQYNELTKSSAVLSKNQPISVWGTAGHVKIDSDTYALVLNNVREQRTEIRQVSINSPNVLSEPVAVYQFEEVQQANLLLDTENEIWFMYYRTNENSYGVKLAPAGDKPLPTLAVP